MLHTASTQPRLLIRGGGVGGLGGGVVVARDIIHQRADKLPSRVGRRGELGRFK